VFSSASIHPLQLGKINDRIFKLAVRQISDFLKAELAFKGATHMRDGSAHMSGPDYVQAFKNE
jgi:hypothetical protein